MKKTLKLFMDKAIDYAGLFPPANLSMDESIKNYADYSNGNDSHLISHFICPVTRFWEFEKSIAGSTLGNSLIPVSALGRKPETVESLSEMVNYDLDVIKKFADCNSTQVGVDVLEMCLPLGVSSVQEKYLGGISDVVNKLDELNFGLIHPFNIFFEVTISSSWQDEILAVINTIVKIKNNLNKKGGENNYLMGFKFRCGGLKIEQYPTVVQTAYCIKMCIDNDVPLKLTAGLHHPFRHYNKFAQTKMHGFVNIFAAVLLGKAHKLEEKTLFEIVEDESYKNFRFDDKSFSWKEIKITIDQILDGRNNNIISYGCCSFDEPREDLRGFGLL